MKNMYICLDVGGTEIKGAAVNVNGNLFSNPRHYRSYADADIDFLINHFTKIILELANPFDVLLGVRLAFPGPFDYQRGICLMRGVSKYDALYGVNLRDMLTKSLREVALMQLADDFDIRFANDVAAFALGELNFGVACESLKSIFVCIGTGCGSAFGVGQKLADDKTPNVPENGYIYNKPFKKSCIDDYISKRGICNLSNEIMHEPLDGYALAKRVDAGDKVATDCFYKFGQLVSEALTPFLIEYNPDILVMGGQITRSANLFIEPLQKQCSERKIKLHLTDDTSKRTIQGLLTI